ncbi:inner membrane-spanning protein YciB, partial [Francisella tularensis]|uniref:inner membrane-spanning protein YciB n=1 Tax=Francisella tularensis TaxID=263 RepID=UPI00174B6761
VSIINWLKGIRLIITTYTMKETPMQKILKDTIDLKEHKWKEINNMWGAYLTVLGTLNLFVAYFFSTDIWMDFKLFGLLGITFVFLIIQSMYLAKHIKR